MCIHSHASVSVLASRHMCREQRNTTVTDDQSRLAVPQDSGRLGYSLVPMTLLPAPHLCVPALARFDVHALHRICAQPYSHSTRFIPTG